MKSLACSGLPVTEDRCRRNGTIEPTRGNRFRPFASAKGWHALPALALAAALPLFAGVAALAQEPARPAPEPAAGGGTGTVEAQNALRLNRKASGGAGGMAQAGVFSDRLQSIVSRVPTGRNPTKALVVLSSTPDPKVQGNLQEDLAVMSHILDKAIEDSLGSDQRFRKAMGVDLFFWPDPGALRHAYLEGYGALFLLNVNFPLLPPPAKSEAQKEEPQVSSAWEEAREEIFGEPGEAGMAPAPPEEPYSEEKVNRLKTSLLEALKNAANIRDLKADEGLTVCVLGGTKPLTGRMQASARSSGARPETMALLTGPAGGAPQRGTILTLRVKKPTIDAFAKGQINLDEFRQKALSTIYEGDTGPGSGFGGYGAVGYGGSYGVKR